MRLKLHKQDLKPCEGRSLIGFNYTSTCPYESIDLLVSVREGNNKRIVCACFLVVLCESVYNDILGRSFLEALDVVASTVHLKMKYHNNLGKSLVIAIDLRRAHLIYEAILRKP